MLVMGVVNRCLILRGPTMLIIEFIWAIAFRKFWSPYIFSPAVEDGGASGKLGGFQLNMHRESLDIGARFVSSATRACWQCRILAAFCFPCFAGEHTCSFSFLPFVAFPKQAPLRACMRKPSSQLDKEVP